MWRERFCRPGRGTIPMIVAGMLALVVMGCSESGGSQAAEFPQAAPESRRTDTIRLTPEAIQTIGLKTEVVARTPLHTPLQVSGRVTYDENRFAHVSAPIAGRVQSFRAHIGDRVKRGDPLAFIESPEIGRAQSDYLRAIAERGVTERAFERAKALLEKKGVSRGEVQRLEGEALRARPSKRPSIT